MTARCEKALVHRREAECDLDLFQFDAMGTTWNVTATVYLPDGAVRVDCADGTWQGRARWYMGARFEDLLGRVDCERLHCELLAEAMKGGAR